MVSIVGTTSLRVRDVPPVTRSLRITSLRSHQGRLVEQAGHTVAIRWTDYDSALVGDVVDCEDNVVSLHFSFAPVCFHIFKQTPLHGL